MNTLLFSFHGNISCHQIITFKYYNQNEHFAEDYDTKTSIPSA